jgi:hypothetical protein
MYYAAWNTTHEIHREPPALPIVYMFATSWTTLSWLYFNLSDPLVPINYTDEIKCCLLDGIAGISSCS